MADLVTQQKRSTTILGPNGKYYTFDVVGFMEEGAALPLGTVALQSFQNGNGQMFYVLVSQMDYEAYIAAATQRAMAAPFGALGLGSPSNFDWNVAHLSGGRPRIGGLPVDQFRGITIDDLSSAYQQAYTGCSEFFMSGGYSQTINLTGLVYPHDVTFFAPPNTTDTPHFIRLRLFRNQFTPAQTSFSLRYFTAKGNGPVDLAQMDYPLGAISMIDQMLFQLPRLQAAASIIRPENFLISTTGQGTVPFRFRLHSAPELGRLIVDFPPATEVPVQAVQNFQAAAYNNAGAIEARRKAVVMALAAGSPVT